MVASGVFPGRFPRRSFSSAYLYKKIDVTPRQLIKTPSRKIQNKKENKTNKDIKNIIIATSSRSRAIKKSPHKTSTRLMKKKMRGQTIKCPDFALSNPVQTTRARVEYNVTW
jgi:hypothetical protein